MPRGIANQGDVKGGGEWCCYGQSFWLYLYSTLVFENTSRSGEATRRLDEMFTMERHWTRTKSLLGDSFMGCRLSTY